MMVMIGLIGCYDYDRQPFIGQLVPASQTLCGGEHADDQHEDMFD